MMLEAVTQTIGEPLMGSINLIADKIILVHRELFDESLSPMKLQKLCYYAQGLYLGGHANPLFPEDFQAWEHGPVCPELYNRFRSYSWRAIADEITPPNLESSIADHIQEIVSSYGLYDAGALSRMTHAEPPWLDAREGLDDTDPCTNVISKASLQSFFKARLASV